MFNLDSFTNLFSKVFGSIFGGNNRNQVQNRGLSLNPNSNRSGGGDFFSNMLGGVGNAASGALSMFGLGNNNRRSSVNPSSPEGIASTGLKAISSVLPGPLGNIANMIGNIIPGIIQLFGGGNNNNNVAAQTTNTLNRNAQDQSSGLTAFSNNPTTTTSDVQGILNNGTQSFSTSIPDFENSKGMFSRVGDSAASPDTSVAATLSGTTTYDSNPGSLRYDSKTGTIADDSINYETTRPNEGSLRYDSKTGTIVDDKSFTSSPFGGESNPTNTLSSLLSQAKSDAVSDGITGALENTTAESAPFEASSDGGSFTDFGDSLTNNNLDAGNLEFSPARDIVGWDDFSSGGFDGGDFSFISSTKQLNNLSGAMVSMNAVSSAEVSARPVDDSMFFNNAALAATA
ncbi:MAG: hypothetical protein ACK5XX_07505 [Holosporales bacterium]